jgi:hypothetical protein
VSDRTPRGAGRSFALVPAGELPERQGIVSFIGSTQRSGRWRVPRHLRVVAVAGNVELDLREAVLSEGTTHIEIAAFAGNVEITVPPGVRVESAGDAMAGNFMCAAGRWPAPAPGAPVLRLSGTAFLANVEARVREVGRSVRRLPGRGGDDDAPRPNA